MQIPVLLSIFSNTGQKIKGDRQFSSGGLRCRVVGLDSPVGSSTKSQDLLQAPSAGFDCTSANLADGMAVRANPFRRPLAELYCLRMASSAPGKP